MNTITTTALVLLIGFFGAIQCIDWSTITASQLSDLPLSAFATITSDELGSIPPQACQGFLANQASSLNVAASPGLTAACLANFPTDSLGGCAGLQEEFIGGMTPQAFGGFQAACIALTPVTAFSFITAQQLAAIPAVACSGFGYNHTGHFPPQAAPGLQRDCLAAFTSMLDMRGGCSGLQGPFVAQIVPSTFEIFTAECIYVAPFSIFANISATQMNQIAPLTFQGLGSVQVTDIPDEAWLSSSKSQLSNLTSSGFSGLRVATLQALLSMYQVELVDAFTVAQTAFYPPILAAEFKSLIPGQVAYVTEWDTVALDLSSTTWLAIALLKKGDSQQAVQGPVFSAEALRMLPFSAVKGLRADHVPLIAAADFKVFNESYTPYLTTDTFSAVSADQLSEISPEAFQSILTETFSAINPEAVSGLTRAQMIFLGGHKFFAMDCKQLQGFTEEQLDFFTPNQRNVYNILYSQECGVSSPSLAVAPSGGPAPVGDSPSNLNSPSSEDSPSGNLNSGGNTPSGQNQPSLTRTEIILAVSLVALVALVVGSVVFFSVRRRRSDPALTRLLSQMN